MNEEETRSKGPDEIYCPECGKPVKKSAVVCVSCGVQIKELKVSQPAQQQTVQPQQMSQQYEQAQQHQPSQPYQQQYQQSPAGAPLVKDTLQEGRLQLSGVRGFYGFFIAIYTIAYIAGTLSLIYIDFSAFAGFYKFITLISMSAAYIIILALYIIPLVGIIKRKPFSVPFTRVMLIVSMFNFPVGTIIGGVLWKRMSHPAAKKYLNHNG